jgi:hypothetical protein
MNMGIWFLVKLFDDEEMSQRKRLSDIYGRGIIEREDMG